MTSKAPDRACVASFVRTCRQPHTSQAFGDEIFFAVTECGSRLPSSTPHPKEPLSALGGLRDRVKPRLRVDVRFAALAARRIARVSAASAAMSPAREPVTVHVEAADVAHSNTGSTAAAITTGTGKLGPLVVAVSGRQAAPCLGSLLPAKCQERSLRVFSTRRPTQAVAIGGDSDVGIITCQVLMCEGRGAAVRLVEPEWESLVVLLALLASGLSRCSGPVAATAVRHRSPDADQLRNQCK